MQLELWISISCDNSYALVADCGNYQIRKIIISTTELNLFTGGTIGVQMG